jgi:hypothetical protein
MYVVAVSGFGLWIGYGVLIGSWPVIGSNACAWRSRAPSLP